MFTSKTLSQSTDDSILKDQKYAMTSIARGERQERDINDIDDCFPYPIFIPPGMYLSVIDSASFCVDDVLMRVEIEYIISDGSKCYDLVQHYQEDSSAYLDFYHAMYASGWNERRGLAGLIGIKEIVEIGYRDGCPIILRRLPNPETALKAVEEAQTWNKL